MENENVEEVLKGKINFDIVNQKLKSFREESKRFLQEALQQSVKEQEPKKNI